MRVVMWRRTIIGIRLLNKDRKVKGKTVDYPLPEKIQKITGTVSCPLG